MTGTGGIANGRLMEERNKWRKDHPIGFSARPTSRGDGSTNLFQWECAVPGKEGTDWEGGVYKVFLEFTHDYPARPPTCRFSPPIFHPNVFKNGAICLSIIGAQYVPGVSVRQILVGIQDLLDTPNFGDPANGEATGIFKRSKAEYKKRVLAEAKRHKPLEVL